MKISTPGKMNLTKKFDRAFQWAGEKMGGEAKTNLGDDFKMLEMEMALRFDGKFRLVFFVFFLPRTTLTIFTGMERLQRSMNAYVKWLGRRDTFEDKEKGLAGGYLGRTMVSHGEDFESDSDFGNCLIGEICHGTVLCRCPTNLSMKPWDAPMKTVPHIRSSSSPMPLLYGSSL